MAGTLEENREYFRKRAQEAKTRDYSADAIKKRFSSGRWDEYDTEYIVAKLREMECRSTVQDAPHWPACDPVNGDFTDGWNQAIDLCRKAFNKWAAYRKP